jgi:small subunit ribosomal protein S6
VPYYETVVVVDPTSDEGTEEKHLAAIRDLIVAQKGSVAKVEHWGKRKLAYSIRHKNEGIYFLVEFEAPGDTVAKLEQYTRLQESILRYLTISREAPSPEGELSPIAREASTEEPERPTEPTEPPEAVEAAEVPTDELLAGASIASIESDEPTEEVEPTETVVDETQALLEAEETEPLVEEKSEEPTEEERKHSEGG